MLWKLRKAASPRFRPRVTNLSSCVRFAAWRDNFVTMRDESNSAALPLTNLWLDLIVGRLINSASDRQRVWIVVDELPVLGRQAKLE